MGKWLYYNFAAGSFHTKKLYCRLYSIENKFYSKQKIAFWVTLWGLRGNVRTPPIARWKARGRLSIRHNWTFFAISYGWDVISGNLSKSAFFEGVGHFERKFQTKGASSTNYCRCQKTRVIALPCGIKISAVNCLVLTQSTRTDWRTNGQN